MILSQAAISDKISTILLSKNENQNANVILFAGAGVGAHAGFPTWRQYLEHLARIAEKYDPLGAELMRNRVANDYFTSAATIYKRNPRMPEGEKYKGLAEPFLNSGEPKELNALLSLQFSAIVTTNFDRALHDSYAEVTQTSPIQVELDDNSLKSAVYLENFYIARIHGRAEFPANFVLDDMDFEEVNSNPQYIDFLLHILTHTTCIFIGYSFLDPAIANVLAILSEKLGPTFPKLHYAFIPNDGNSLLANSLARYNIEVFQYDPKNKHEVLWNGIKDASRKLGLQEKIDKPKLHFSLETTHRFLAMAYTKNKVKEETAIEPLRTLITDSILMDVISSFDRNGCTLDELVRGIRKLIPLSQSEAKSLVSSRLSTLVSNEFCYWEGERLRLTDKIIPKITLIHDDISTLAEGVINRALVRESYNFDTAHKPMLQEATEEIILLRGWDLGAYFSGSKETSLLNITPTIRRSLAKFLANLDEQERDALANAAFDLFNSPDEIESEILAEFGRISFGMQLILGSPTQYLVHNVVLPEKIYLDSNVLLPAITPGHPYNKVYEDAISRLRAAALDSGISVEVIVIEGFLNEVVSHRRNAFHQVKELGLEDPNELESFILYNGAENTNAYVSAYASEVGRLKRRVFFETFLYEIAPYNTESELSAFLEKYEISTQKVAVNSETRIERHGEISQQLIQSYLEGSRAHPKPNVLIRHEANQLLLLEDDQLRGIRSIFSTSDNSLRDAANSKPLLNRVANAIINRRGLVLLLDFLLGVDTDAISTTRILWGGNFSDEYATVRNYLIDLALRYFHQAMNLSMMNIVDDLTKEILKTARTENVSLFPSSNTEKSAKRIRYIDRFEERFYDEMANAAKQSFS